MTGHCFITTLFHGPDYPGPLAHLCSMRVSWSWWLHTGSGKSCLTLYSCLLIDVGGQCGPHSARDLCHTTVKISINCQPDRLCNRSWTCLWSIILIVLIGVGRSTMSSTIPWMGLQTGGGERAEQQQTLSALCFKSCCFDFSVMMDCHPDLSVWW